MIICENNTVFAKSDFWSKTRQPAPVSPTFVKYRPLVGNEHVGKIRSPRSGARRCLLGLSSTTLFLVIFKYFNVIIKKIEMFFVVPNITAS